MTCDDPSRTGLLVGFNVVVAILDVSTDIMSEFPRPISYYPGHQS